MSSRHQSARYTRVFRRSAWTDTPTTEEGRHGRGEETGNGGTISLSIIARVIMKHAISMNLTLFVSMVLCVLSATAEVTEQELGIPFYPSAKPVPGIVPSESVRNGQLFLNINLISPDSFRKVLLFYEERMGKFSIFKSQATAKSALWYESTPKGYRIITLVETNEGTKITLSRRIW